MSGPTFMSWRSVEAGGWEHVKQIWNPSRRNNRLKVVPLRVGPGTEQFEYSSP